MSAAPITYISLSPLPPKKSHRIDSPKVITQLIHPEKKHITRPPPKKNTTKNPRTHQKITQHSPNKLLENAGKHEQSIWPYDEACAWHVRLELESHTCCKAMRRWRGSKSEEALVMGWGPEHHYQPLAGWPMRSLRYVHESSSSPLCRSSGGHVLSPVRCPSALPFIMIIHQDQVQMSARASDVPPTRWYSGRAGKAHRILQPRSMTLQAQLCASTLARPLYHRSGGTSDAPMNVQRAGFVGLCFLVVRCGAAFATRPLYHRFGGTSDARAKLCSVCAQIRALARSSNPSTQKQLVVRIQLQFCRCRAPTRGKHQSKIIPPLLY